MTALRVAFVIMDVGPVGGMERQATEVLRGLVDEGHDVTVVARTCDLGDLEGVRFVRVPVPQRPFSVAFPLWVLLATAAVARLRADVVHVNGAIVLSRADVVTMHFCHHAYQSAFGLAERTRPGVLHRGNAWVASTLARGMEAWCLRPGRAAHVVAISEGVAREVAHWFPRRPRPPEIIPYGVDTLRFRPSPEARARVRGELGLGEQELLAVLVGGDWERKGVRQAIEALDGRAAWTLAVAGTGDRARYGAQARALGVGERVRFTGSVDPAGLYAAGDAFVLPTAYETFSLATHEAAAAGLPLLVTRVSGPDVLVAPGVNGWFVERSGPDVAARLAALEDAPALRKEMGAAARAGVLGLTWDRVRSAHAALYARIAAGDRGAPRARRRRP